MPAFAQACEDAADRVRERRWGPRTLDLDVLLYGDQIIASADMAVPHPGIAEREFVLYPLAGIAPGDLNIPGKGFLNTLLANCLRRGLEILEHA